MNKKIYDILGKISTNVYMLVFVLFFSLFFVNVYEPFEAYSWFPAKDPSRSFLISTFVILCGIAIMAISRVILVVVNQKSKLSVLSYILWLIGEIFVISLLYTLINVYALKDPRPASTLFKGTILFVPGILFIPYLVSYLFLAVTYQKKTINTLTEKKKEDFAQLQHVDETVNFCDEKGRLRLSIKNNSIFYIEANDNYVKIHYSDNGKVGFTMLRNKLKNLEEELNAYGFVRCHRSYMINLHKIKMIMREKDSFFIVFEESSIGKIPMSKTYSDEVMRRFTE